MVVADEHLPLILLTRYTAGDDLAPAREPHPGAGAAEDIRHRHRQEWSAADEPYCSGVGPTARPVPEGHGRRPVAQCAPAAATRRPGERCRSHRTCGTPKTAPREPSGQGPAP